MGTTERSPGSWQQVRELFEQVLELPEAERKDFLSRRLPDEPKVLAEVESLLQAHLAAGDLWQRVRAPKWQPQTWRPESLGSKKFGAETVRSQAWQPPLDPNLVGRCLGAYRLLEVIGEGGMSVVYLAERADQAYSRQVAVKVRRQGRHSETLDHRFRRERQILAQLEHPNIAGLLDGGTSEDGRPYVVMEFVEGLRIDLYCDRHRLSIEKRIHLFLEVCAAVEYSHRNLIVHRDLKPGNILVTVEGRAKLLDFGIAKLMAAENESSLARTTAPWMRLMTPSYASPEQARGEMVTTAGDVYSLGVILYGLLSGRPPYRLGNKSALEIENLLSGFQPPACSSALELHPEGRNDGGSLDLPAATVCAARDVRPDSLRRRLRGDLDLIVAKAMHKDAERRYGSVADLARDLERHLGGLPVAARPDDWLYRSQKFMRRNRLPLAVVLMFLMLGVAFLVSTQNQTLRLAEERDRARAERDMNQEMLTFLKETFSTFSPESSRGENLTAKEILDRGARRVGYQLSDRPWLQAELFRTLGEVNLGLGRYALAEQQIARSVDLRGGIRDDYGSASDLHLLAMAKLRMSRPKEAGALFYRALKVAQWRASAADEISALSGLGEALRMQGDLSKAVQQLEAALRLDRQTFTNQHLGTADILLSLAKTYSQLGEHDVARGHVEQAIEIQSRSLDPEHPRLAQSLQGLLKILIHQDDYDRADEVGMEVLELQTKLLGADHPELIITLDGLGRLAADRQDIERAEYFYRRAEEIARQSFGADDPRLAHALSGLVRGLRLAGRRQAALSYAREALAIHRRDPDGDPSDLASSLFNVAYLLEEEGEMEGVIQLYEESLAISRLEPDHHELAFPSVQLAQIMMRRGRVDRAEVLFRQAYEVRRRVLPEGHELTQAAADQLALVLERQGKWSEAEPLLLQALAAEQRLAANDPSRAEQLEPLRRRLFHLYRDWGRGEQAERYASANWVRP